MTDKNFFEKDYYNQAAGVIKPIDLLRVMPFSLGTTCKYLMRARYKGTEKQDLAKAADYLDLFIEEMRTPVIATAYRAQLAPIWHLLKCFPNEFLSELYETRLDLASLREFLSKLRSEI